MSQATIDLMVITVVPSSPLMPRGQGWWIRLACERQYIRQIHPIYGIVDF